jgi:hypothetical protein
MVLWGSSVRSTTDDIRQGSASRTGVNSGLVVVIIIFIFMVAPVALQCWTALQFGRYDSTSRDKTLFRKDKKKVEYSSPR